MDGIGWLPMELEKEKAKGGEVSRSAPLARTIFDEETSRFA